MGGRAGTLTSSVETLIPRLHEQRLVLHDGPRDPPYLGPGERGDTLFEASGLDAPLAFPVWPRDVTPVAMRPSRYFGEPSTRWT